MFQREHERLQYEIRRDFDSREIEVVITGPDGTNQERIESPSEVLRRSEERWAALMASGWHPVPCSTLSAASRVS